MGERSEGMRIAVLGAGGGLGRNVVDAALAAKHDVVALVRDPKRAALPEGVTTVVGDAIRVDDAVRAMTGADAAMFCVNPPFATWLTTFRPLLQCAIAAARQIKFVPAVRGGHPVSVFMQLEYNFNLY